MANMSYCRFQNTLSDLWDCARNLHDPKLSKNERWARTQLVELCARIVESADTREHLDECECAECAGDEECPVCGAVMDPLNGCPNRKCYNHVDPEDMPEGYDREEEA